MFKVENFNDLEIFNDYFDPAKLNKRMNRKPQATTTKSLLIERGQHYCKIKDFTKNLAVMYDHESEEQQNKLLLCKDLDIKKKMSYMESHKKVLKFCTQVKRFVNE